MAGSAQAGSGNKGTRLVPYIIVALVIAALVVVAYFQEPLGHYFSLHAWDKEAPARTVTAFLNAGRKGDQQQASSYLGAQDLHPFVQNGKFVGYTLPTMAGTLEMRFDSLAAADPKPSATEFVYQGDGAAEVKVPDVHGKDVTYRLKMQGGAWKIMEIRAGTKQ
jgi:hypothetical protein